MRRSRAARWLSVPSRPTEARCWNCRASNPTGCVEAEIQARDTQLTQARNELREFSADELEIARLKRELGIRELTYQRYAAVAEDARFDQALQRQRMTNISIVQSPSYEIKHIKPRRLLNLLLGLAAAVFGGIALAVLAEYGDRTFVTPEDIEKRIHIPSLATLPRLNGEELVMTGVRAPQ